MENGFNFLTNIGEGAETVISLISTDGSESENNIDFKEIQGDIPILILRNTVIFPGTSQPIAVAREKSINLIKSLKRDKSAFVGLVCQKDPDMEEPTVEDLYPVGVIATVLRVFEFPEENSVTVIFQGRTRFSLGEITQQEPYLKAHISLLKDKPAKKNDKEYSVVLEQIADLALQMLRMYGEPPQELVQKFKSMKKSPALVNFCCTNLILTGAEKQELLFMDSEREKAFKLAMILDREVQMMEMKMKIQLKTREELNQQQREYFLQQQIKTIQNELGGNPQQADLEEMRQRAQKKKWTKETAEIFEKEMKKIERLHPQSPDYSTQFAYLEQLLELPWNEYTKDSFNLRRAKKILERDHFGLDKVKERIIEHLAVLKLKNDMKSPILCFYGPPGVGKTSLGKSIAEALNRKYARISLGGLHDEAEIRGHRRTYIGAMPGRIIQSILKAGSANPVFVLDEVDKIGHDFRGDPEAALLEVLDPEQNSKFHDNYINIDFDLSHVLFIATANNISAVAQPLLDRMELIDVSGYIIEEKREIAARHLLPKQIEAHGLKAEDLQIPKDVMTEIIENYTRESGVRQLDKTLAKIARKTALKVAAKEQFNQKITSADIRNYLGAPLFNKELYEGNKYAGVVTGLAWTAVGGEILFIETSLSKGKGGKLTLTGNLGDVMKESATLAVEYIHAHNKDLNIPDEIFDNWNIHIHIPEGAIPKDGPSAGITMVTSIASALTQRKVKPLLAMTGEMTLRGKVMPVGGIREKILAAKRAGIKEIILCAQNKKDIDEIKESYLQGLQFHFVNDIDEVLQIALLDEKVDKPLIFSV